MTGLPAATHEAAQANEALHEKSESSFSVLEINCTQAALWLCAVAACLFAARLHAREGGMPDDTDYSLLNTRVRQELHQAPPQRKDLRGSTTILGS